MFFDEILDCSAMRYLERSKTPQIQLLENLLMAREHFNGNSLGIMTKFLESSRSVTLMLIYHQLLIDAFVRSLVHI